MMANNKKIVVLDVDTIVTSSVDRNTFENLPPTKKIRIYYHAQEIVKIMQSHPL
jgi:lipopolysaccharide biosynthesis glycosyltransferase|tara:strand:- start:284 stop:445 length:162 start_codon:yes stop_codon:yes gene_type:complete